MSCSCTKDLNHGKDIVDLIKRKGKESVVPAIKHEINCDCGETFLLQTVIMNCPKCEMTYAVTPCGSDNKNNIKQAGINYI